MRFTALIGLFWAVAAAAASPPSPPNSASVAAPSEPLPLKAFLSQPALSLVRLSPSGKSIALVRRSGELDQLLRVDLPDFKTTLLYQTQPLKDWQVKQHFRQSISYLDWKSDDKLVMTIDTPVGRDAYDAVEEPVHLVVSAGGGASPVLLNAKISGGVARVDLSWIQSLLRDDPNHVMIGVRKSYSTVQLDRVDITDASHARLEVGDSSVVGFGTDRKGDIVTRTLEHDDGSLTLQGRAAGETKWTKIFDFRRKAQEELSKFGFFGAGEVGTLYLAVKPESAADGDTEVVRTYDLKAQKLGPVVWSNPSYDVAAIVQAEETGKFLAGCYWADTLQCEFGAPKLTANLNGLNKFFENKESLVIVSQSEDDSTWILYAAGPDDPGSYFVYDVPAHHLRQLGVVHPELPADQLGRMRRLDFKARDGAPLSAYVTEPPGVHQGPMPLVVMPHGGPEVRDHYSFDEWSQFLATRGYLVLQPKFRGSGGYGRAFAEAGHGEWGQRMHDDVMDATHALIAEGAVDPRRVCVVGGSYGGYEALYAAATEPKTFSCAVSLDGISDLSAFVKWQKSFGDDPDRYAHWRKLVGDPDADRGKLEAHSPSRLTASWTTPLLLIHGGADDIVPVEQSRRMKRALEAAGKPVRYLEIKDMGHGPATDQERTQVYSEMASFLASYLKPR